MTTEPTVFCVSWRNPFTGAFGGATFNTWRELLDKVEVLFEDPTTTVDTFVLDPEGVQIPVTVPGSLVP